MKDISKLQFLIEKSLDEIKKDDPQKRCLNRLLFYIQKSQKVYKDSHPDYLEALDKTFEWLIRNLEDFQPQIGITIEESFFRWINSYLKMRILDLKIAQTKNPLSLDQSIDEGSNQKVSWGDQMSDTNLMAPPTLSGLDGYIAQLKQQKDRTIVSKLERYVEEDLENKLKNLHIRSESRCNCQYLSQKALFQNPPERFSNLSRDLNVNYQTLKSHWEAKCKPCLQDILYSLGYSHDV